MTKRTYVGQDFCPVARTLDVVGDRWAVLILRDLAWGRKRFGELERSLVGIGPNQLTDRLRSLEAEGMVTRVAYSDTPPRYHYRLTEKGRGFIPVLLALVEFGERWQPATEPPATHPPTGSI